MPSPNSITDLVIFSAGAIGFVIIFMLVTRFTPWGRKLSESLKTGPVEIKPHTPDPTQPRKVYPDPLANVNMGLVIGIFAVLMVLTFVFYFMTRQTFLGGN